LGTGTADLYLKISEESIRSRRQDRSPVVLDMEERSAYVLGIDGPEEHNNDARGLK
jgi:hypothetical protein